MSVIATVFGKALGISAEEADEFTTISEKEVLYNVTVQKKGSILGLAYRVIDEKEGIIITGIVSGSAVQDWNEVCDEDQIICVGDKIQCINGETDPRDMVREMQAAPLITMNLVKMGPRWHVLGVTAECMEKINLAMDKGMKMVLAREETVVREEPEEQPNLTKFQSLLLFVSALVPNLVLVAMLSDIGAGIQVYSRLAPSRVDFMGRGIVCLSILFAFSLLILDWSRWEVAWQKRMTLATCCYGFLIGGFLMARNYPELPLVILLLHVPVLLGILRATALKSVRRPSFYGGVAKGLLIISLMILTLWLVWMNVPLGRKGTRRWDDATKEDLIERSQRVYQEFDIVIENEDGQPGAPHPMVSQWYCNDQDQTQEFLLNYDLYVETGKLEPLTSACGWETPKECKLSQSNISLVKKVCASVKTTWLLVWASPLVCFGANFLFCLFCVINGAWLRVTNLDQLEKAVKNFLLIVAMASAAGWVSISVAGASTRLTGALLSFCGAGVLLLCIWVYLEIGERAITATLKRSKLMQQLLGLATSDWARACIIVPVFLFTPQALFINFLNQRARRLRDADAERSWFTKGANDIFMALSSWRWVSILTKTNMLAVVYFMLFSGAGKFAVVFLSWLNEKLSADFFFVESLVIFFVVGFLMFMLPPVPGIPVYWCAGIIIVAQAKKAGVGFTLGCFVAVALCVSLKCVAACGQYMIGYFLGGSVKVQQQVGVDKELIKAIEMILQERGLTLPKVAVLIGGPDWPTSVLCGLLRINIPQMLIGTLPIFFLCAPSVLFGAFLVTPIDEGVEDVEGRALWATLSNMMLGMSALSQLMAACLALYFMQDKVFNYAEELSKPRPEHAKIIALTESEAAYMACYDRITDWSRLSCCLKTLILSSTTCMLMQGYLLTFADSICFRPFQVYNRIGDPGIEGGLDGDVGSFIMFWGRVAMLLFATGCIFHVIFSWVTGRMAKRALAQADQTSCTPNGKRVSFQC